MKKTNQKATTKQKILLISISIIAGLIFAELLLQLMGLFFSINYKRNNTNVKNENEYRILCIGESTTAPTSPVNDYSYPIQLQEMLDEKEHAVSYKVINEGICGASTSDALSRLDDQLDKYQPQMVILMAGTNDSGLTINYNNNIFSKFIVFVQSLRTYKLLIAGPVKYFIYKDMKKIKKENTGSENESDDENNNNSNGDNDENNDNNSKKDNSKHSVFDDYLSYFKWLSENDKTLYQDSLIDFIKKNPLSDIDLYIMAAVIYKEQEEYETAVDLLNKASLLFPKDDPKYYKIYNGLIDIYDYFITNNSKYKNRYNGETVIRNYEKLIKLLPDDKDIHFEFCRRILSYYGNHNCPDMDFLKTYIKNKLMPVLMKTFSLSGDDEKHKVIFFIGKHFYLLQDFENAEKYLNLAASFEIKSDELKGDARIISDDLAVSYLLEIYKGDYEKTKDLLMQVADKNENLLAYKTLYLLYSEKGEASKAKQTLNKIKKYESNKIIPSYYFNYRKICRIILDKNIKLISMSYPNRNTDSLEEMLKDMKKEIIFVSNDKSFKIALKEKGINEIFADLFGGDFGHCTSQGYRIIANNLFPLIIKESQINK